MATTIQISKKLQDFLSQRKLYNKETYEEVIWDLIEDSKELSKETLNNIKQAQDDIKKGKTFTHDEIKKELEL